MQRRKLEELNRLDNFMFGSVVTYPGIGEAFAKSLLKVIFERKFADLIVIPQNIYCGSKRIYTEPDWISFLKRMRRQRIQGC